MPRSFPNVKAIICPITIHIKDQPVIRAIRIRILWCVWESARLIIAFEMISVLTDIDCTKVISKSWRASPTVAAGRHRNWWQKQEGGENWSSRSYRSWSNLDVFFRRSMHAWSAFMHLRLFIYLLIICTRSQLTLVVGVRLCLALFHRFPPGTIARELEWVQLK